jgi:hypothetical protein
MSFSATATGWACSNPRGSSHWMVVAVPAAPGFLPIRVPVLVHPEMHPGQDDATGRSGVSWRELGWRGVWAALQRAGETKTQAAAMARRRFTKSNMAQICILQSNF